jgi:hypothetical protein
VALHLELDAGRGVLARALKQASVSGYKARSPINSDIQRVLTGDHLTYRYVFVTALVAKSMDQRVNCLALQAGADFDGAYDARSLCHKVLVPFEREYLANALGGSNEPFLNKPARYTHLSLTNAVRRGNDRETLDLLCRVLPLVGTSAKAFDALVDALNILVSIGEKSKLPEVVVTVFGENQKAEIMSLVDRLVSRSMEGESCSLAVTAILGCLSLSSFKGAKVEVHPVNQCGASSLEVSDVDVFYEGKLTASLEVKDKRFTKHDVGHAASKVMAAGFDSLFFIKGPSGVLIDAKEDDLVAAYRSRGFILNILTVQDFVAVVLGFIRGVSYATYCEVLFAQARVARVKGETRRHLEAVCQVRS